MKHIQPVAGPHDDRRYTVTVPVESPRDHGLEDVGAASMEVLPSGALAFFDADGTMNLTYAPHAWKTVVPS